MPHIISVSLNNNCFSLFTFYQSTVMKRLLVINRNWNYDLPQLPKVDVKTWNTQWEAYKDQFEERFLASHGQLDFSRVDYVEHGDSVKQDFILRTDFDLPKGLSDPHEAERKNLLSFLKETLMHDSPNEGDSVQVLYLFLFHNAKELTLHETFQKKNVRARSFGGGRAIIYGEKGLLGNDRRYFSDVYQEELEVASEIDSSGIFKIIKPHNFERVWNYYWSRTEERLRVMAQEAKKALIPGYSSDQVNFAQSFVNNFLTHIQGEERPERKVVAETDFYDFSACEDLPEIGEILQADFGPLRDELVQFLTDPKKVNKGLFRENIDPFIEKVASR